MSRILFAWELGGNLGHLTRDLPLARRCRGAGHEVAWAAKDLALAEQVVGAEGFSYFQSPVLRRLTRSAPPINYSDMLLGDGYADQYGLAGAFKGWLSLLAQLKPDVLVYNHSPTALLAARARGIPVLLLGTGFELPPMRTGQACFLPQAAVSLARHEAAERKLIRSINGLLEPHGLPSIDALADVFREHEFILATFPQLDHFGPRDGAAYIGPLFATPSLPPVAWASDNKQRVILYLSPMVPGLENILQALAESSAEVICAIPGMPSSWPARYHRLRFFSHAVDLGNLMGAATLVVTAGAGTMALALLFGVPVLAVPHVIEQMLGGIALAKTGAGEAMGMDRSLECSREQLARLMDPSFAAMARKFASEHSAFSSDLAADYLLQRVGRLTGGQGSGTPSRSDLL